MLNHTVRLGRIVVGLVLLVAGILLSLPFIPGPGIVIAAIGIGLLSHEFEWARSLRDWVHRELGWDGRLRSWARREFDRLRSRNAG